MTSRAVGMPRPDLMKGADGLNQGQRVFAREYLRDFNASRAAIDAGYAPRSAPSQAAELLKNPKVRDFIREELDRRIALAEVDERWVLFKLRKVVEGAMEDRKWAPATRALELLGQHFGAWGVRQPNAADLLNQPANSEPPPTPTSVTMVYNDFRQVAASLLEMLPPEEVSERANRAIGFVPADEDEDDE